MARSIPRALGLLVLSGWLAAPALAGDPTAPAPHLLLTRSTPLPGCPAGGAVLDSLDLDMTPSGWMVRAITGLSLDVAIVDGQWTSYQGQSVGPVATLSALGASFDRDASGQTVLLARIGDTGLGLPQGVVLDDLLVLLEGDAVSGDGIPAGATWDGIDGVALTEDGGLIVNGWLEVPDQPGDQVTLIARYELPAGSSLGPATALAAEDQALDQGLIEWMPANADTGWAVTAAHLMHTVAYQGVGGFGGPAGVVLDGVTLALDGQPSIVPGRNWRMHAWLDAVDVSTNGHWAFRTRVDGPDDGYDVIVADGALVAMESKPAPGFPGTTVVALGGPRVSENGQVMWSARWHDGVTFSYGLFLNDQLLVKDGTLCDDGHVLTSVYADERFFGVSPDGSTAIFKADRDDGEFGLYEITVGPWVSQGHALAGTGGLPPRLAGHGDQTPGSATTLALFEALPSTLAGFFLGFSQLDLPFKGGVLCPSPDVIVPSLPVSSAGELVVAFPWPAGIPAGTNLWWQSWVLDAGAPKGLGASNCLRSITP